jgi:heptosyltransferase-3
VSGRRRALVIHPGALGDVLLALPALAHLGDLLPGCHRTLAAGPRPARLLAGSGYAEETVELDRLGLHRLFVAEPDADLLARLGAYDAIVSWLGAGDPTYAAHLRGLGPPVVLARAAPPAGARRHVSRHLVETLAPIGATAATVPAIHLTPGDVERAWAARWLAARGLAPGEFVTVHPGAGSPAKVWPGYPALTRCLLAERRPVVVVTGPADAAATDWLAGDAGRAHVASDLPLRRLAALLAAAGVFVGNDSGPTHLAAVVGSPTVALFGPTDPAVWAPVGPRVSVLTGAGPGAADPWAGLGVDRVLALVAGGLAAVRAGVA